MYPFYGCLINNRSIFSFFRNKNNNDRFLSVSSVVTSVRSEKFSFSFYRGTELVDKMACFMNFQKLEILRIERLVENRRDSKEKLLSFLSLRKLGIN